MAEEQESLSDFVTRQFDEATAPIREHADAALERLGRLDTLAPRKPGVQPEWAYHSGYLRQRIGDIRLIVDRLFAAQWEVVQLHVARRGTEETGGTLDPRELTLPDQMGLDFECLYVVGNLALDQWAMLATSLAGDLDRAPSGADFAYLVNQLQGGTYAGVLRPLWAQHHADLIWLFFNLRFVRNCFIEHVRVERHHWRVSGGYTPHFELAMPAAIRPGQPLPISAEDARAIQDFGRRFLDIPGNADVDQESVTFLLQSLLNSIEAVPEQVDREGIWALANRIGIQTPSYHIVARRLLQFLDRSLGTLTDIIFA